MWAFLLIVILILTIGVYFRMPFSSLESDFYKLVTSQVSNIEASVEMFTSAEIKRLPFPVKKHIETCGFIGKPKMSYVKAYYENVDFLMSADKPYTKINYTQYTFAQKPARLAFIDTSMFGIPFQGLDSYTDGKGGMKGVLAKTLTLFDETGPEMNTACLANILSECLFVPSIALQDYITWEYVDETHAKATISYYGISASGLFAFSDNGELSSFTTNDRWAVETDGRKTLVPWSLLFGNYEEKNGIRQATSYKAVWHYAKGDSVYFDSKNPIIEYL